MDLNPTQKVSLAGDILIQDLAGESVLLNLESEEYFGLDEVGTQMLSVLNESASIQVAYQILLTQYEVDEVQLKQDLLELIEQLAKHGLVQVTES